MLSCLGPNAHLNSYVLKTQENIHLRDCRSGRLAWRACGVGEQVADRHGYSSDVELALDVTHVRTVSAGACGKLARRARSDAVT